MPPEYTVGISSTARGRHGSCLWLAHEIAMASKVIAPSTGERSGLIDTEGYRHFMVWMSRSVAIQLSVGIIACAPYVQDGPPAETNSFTIATWANTGGSNGCFYFGQELQTSQDGKTLRFSPLIKLFISNNTVTPVTVDAHVYCAE